MSSSNSQTLLIGCGGVGTIAALNLELGGCTEVSAVLRSNYEAVKRDGFDIRSCDHGTVKKWRPSQVINAIPDIKDRDTPFDYIVCTTKNTPDIPPGLAAQIALAVTPGHTVIVLIQNGLNIEKPLIEKFPNNIILSGVSMIGSHEVSPSVIEHEFPDELIVGAFRNPNLDAEKEDAAAKRFVEIYGAGGKTACSFTDQVSYSRWRKLVYNACLNPICAITGLDTGRIRLADGAVESLVRPAMEEIVAAAKAVGYDLPKDIANTMIGVDPLTMYLPPSMLADVRKGNFIEYENILGEPMREGISRGVPMPTLKVLYGMCQALQWRTKEAKGMVDIPHKDVTDNKS